MAELLCPQMQKKNLETEQGSQGAMVSRAEGEARSQTPGSGAFLSHLFKFIGSCVLPSCFTFHERVLVTRVLFLFGSSNAGAG